MSTGGTQKGLTIDEAAYVRDRAARLGIGRPVPRALVNQYVNPDRVAAAAPFPGDLLDIAKEIVAGLKSMGVGIPTELDPNDDKFIGRRLLNWLGKRVCDFPDNIEGLEEAKCTWNNRPVTVGIIPFSGLTPEEQIWVTKRACENWMEVIDLDLVVVDPGKPANITPNARNLGGRGGVLAQSELVPCGASATTQIGQWYDTSENWKQWPDLGFPVVVGTHELGHAIGFGHIAGVGTAVMNAILTDKITALTSLDRNQALSFYAARTSRPTDPPPDDPTTPPTTPADDVELFRIIHRYMKNGIIRYEKS